MTLWRMQLHPTEQGQALKQSVESLAAGFIGLGFLSDFEGRVSLGFCLFGPPAVAVGAPIASWLILWTRRRTLQATGRPSGHPVGWIVAALLAWCGISTGAVLFYQYLGFVYAWMWAHPPDVSTVPPEPPWFAIVGGLLLMCGIAIVLHRFVARRYTMSRALA